LGSFFQILLQRYNLLIINILKHLINLHLFIHSINHFFPLMLILFNLFIHVLQLFNLHTYKLLKSLEMLFLLIQNIFISFLHIHFIKGDMVLEGIYLSSFERREEGFWFNIRYLIFFID